MTQAGQAKRALSRTRAGLVGLLAVALVASSQAASAAPKDKVEVLDGATLDDPSREPSAMSGARFTCGASASKPPRHAPARRRNDVGPLCWNELATRETQTATLSVCARMRSTVTTPGRVPRGAPSHGGIRYRGGSGALGLGGGAKKSLTGATLSLEMSTQLGAADGGAPVAPASAEGAAIVEIGLAPRRWRRTLYRCGETGLRSRRHRVLPAAAVHAGTPTEASHRAHARRARVSRAVRGVASRGAQARACERCPGRA